MKENGNHSLHFSYVVWTKVLSLAALTTFFILPAHGLEENGVLETPFTENPPLIDGKWTSESEWSDANVVYMQKDGHEMYLLVKHDRDFIYFIFDAISDQVECDEGIINYHVAMLMFDTNNDGGNIRQNDDIRITRGEILDSKCQPTNYSDVKTNSFTVGDPGAQDERMGREINEPSQFKYAKSISSRNSPYESGRDHYIHEFRVPISFLHKSDTYGFAAAYDMGTFSNEVNNKVFITWPPTLQQSWIVNQYGNLVAIGNTITAPPVPVITVSPDSLSFGNVVVSEKSSPKTVTIKNQGTGKLKISSISVSGQFSFSGIKTPVELEPQESASFDVVFAPLSLEEKSGSISISSNDLSKPTVRITTSGNGVEKGVLGGGCLIATATFGSELAPQVQMLREIRDTTVLSTASGTSFISTFNAFYYSLSPTVADWERQNPAFKEAVKLTITPLLSSLVLLQYVDIDSEAEMLGYGIGIILLNLGMYFVAPAFLIVKLKRMINLKS